MWPVTRRPATLDSVSGHSPLASWLQQAPSAHRDSLHQPQVSQYGGSGSTRRVHQVDSAQRLCYIGGGSPRCGGKRGFSGLEDKMEGAS